MEIDVQDKTKLFDLMKAHGLGSEPVIIGIDGSNGTGKSTLAYCIGCTFKIPVVNIDQFVGQIGESYRDAVLLSALSKPISRYINNKRTFVIEGICLLDILEGLKISADILIYYKKYNSRREWLDEEECNCFLNAAEIDALPPLQKAIAKYHNAFHPIEKATCIVYRVYE